MRSRHTLGEARLPEIVATPARRARNGYLAKGYQSMSNHVGTLVRKRDEHHGMYFQGNLHLEQVQGQAFLVPQPKRNENSPDFKLRVRRAGGVFDYGSAWLGKMRGEDGAEYVSITISAPGIAPIYVKAFPADHQPKEYDEKTGEGQVLNVIWSPSRAAGGAAAPRMAGHAQVNDAIPF